MAQVTIAGSSYVITSAVAMADLETVKKYRPSALAITDPETKETLFRVGIGTSSMNEHGVSFGGVSNDDKKLATATLTIPHDVEDAKEHVLDKAGISLVNLEKIEGEIAEVLEDIKKQRESIAESIKVIV